MSSDKWIACSDFEQWLRATCFKRPPDSAKDLAMDAWNHQKSKIAELEQQLSALQEGLERLISIAERCDGWEFFPSDELDAAISALQESEK